MPVNPKLKAEFYFNGHYHIVFKSIDGLKLFYNEADYSTFKKRFLEFLMPFFEQCAFCLLDNHTHHILKVASQNTINSYLHSLNELDKTILIENYLKNNAESNFDLMLEKQIAKFMVSYANYIGNKYKRKGGLFQKPFKRIRIENEAHLQKAIIYVNANAQHHNLCDDFKKHMHNGYNDFIKNEQLFISSRNILSIFNTKDFFIKLHQEQVDYYYKLNWPSSKIE